MKKIKNAKSISRGQIPQQYKDRVKKTNELCRDYEFNARLKFIIKNKLSELKEELISELGRCCKEHGIDKKTLEHFVLADEVHDTFTRWLDPKVNEDLESLFIDFAEELGYIYHVGNGIYSYIGYDDGFPMPESMLLK